MTLKILKFCWALELFLAAVLIQFVGRGYIANPGGAWREFGFPLPYCGTKGMDVEKPTVWSARVFTLSRWDGGQPWLNRGVFLWENGDSISGFSPGSIWADTAFSLLILAGVAWCVFGQTFSRHPVLWRTIVLGTQILLVVQAICSVYEFWVWRDHACYIDEWLYRCCQMLYGIAAAAILVALLDWLFRKRHRPQPSDDSNPLIRIPDDLTKQ